jgi:hypothetical protein
MLVVNLCSASIGFLHQVYTVGTSNCTGFSVDPIYSGDDSALSPSISLKDAARLCDGAPLPRGFPGVGVLLVPGMGDPTPVALFLEVGIMILFLFYLLPCQLIYFYK